MDETTYCIVVTRRDGQTVEKHDLSVPPNQNVPKLGARIFGGTVTGVMPSTRHPDRLEITVDLDPEA